MNASQTVNMAQSSGMALAGFLVVILIFATFTFGVKKLSNFRISGASIIASFFISFIVGLTVIWFLTITTNEFWPATFLLVILSSYIGLLKIFEPDDLATLYAKEQRAIKKLEVKAAKEDKLKDYRNGKLEEKKAKLKNSQNNSSTKRGSEDA